MAWCSIRRAARAVLPLLLVVLAAAASPPSSMNLAFASLPSRRVGGGAASATTSSSSAFLGRGMRLATVPRRQQQRQRQGRSSGGGSGGGMTMFLGTDGGVLGVGAPEIAVIVLVGYFILGPTELYKLTKEIGKTIQNFRSLSTEASKTFEDTMENQLELGELRKAQQELNDAFNFRRSINTDDKLDPFEEKIVPPTETAAAASAAATANTADGAGAVTKKKKVKRRRVKKQPTPEELGTGGQVPDLDMTAAFETAEKQQRDMMTAEPVVAADDEAARLREERKARLTSGSQPDSKPDWFDDRGLEDLTEKQPSTLFGDDPWTETKAEEQDRFASQLSGQWNDSVLQAGESLEPLAKVMERLAILEEEKNAADLRLEEEFRLRGELEEKFYRSKKELLEEAAAEVQAEAYAGMGTGSGDGVGGDGDGKDDKKKEGSESKKEKEGSSSSSASSGTKV